MAKKKLYRNEDFYKWNLKEINAARAVVGMKPLEYTMKKCLSCDEEFESNGANNRMCEGCYSHDDGLQVHSIKKP